MYYTYPIYFCFTDRAMESEQQSVSQCRKASDDIPKVHTKCNHKRPHTRFTFVQISLFKFYLIMDWNPKYPCPKPSVKIVYYHKCRFSLLNSLNLNSLKNEFKFLINELNSQF